MVPAKDAGGSRTHLDRVAAGCLAVWLQRRDGDVLARSRTWSTTSAKSRANPSHSKDLKFRRLGVEPSLAAPKAAVPIRDARGVPSPGVEPGLRPPQSRVRIRHTPRAGSSFREQGREDSNPVRPGWSRSPLPGGRPCRLSSRARGGCLTGIEPAPRDPRSRVLPLHHGHSLPHAPTVGDAGLETAASDMSHRRSGPLS